MEPQPKRNIISFEFPEKDELDQWREKNQIPRGYISLFLQKQLLHHIRTVSFPERGGKNPQEKQEREVSKKC